jgi:DNA-binding MarR family transcriptional regulator
VVAVPDATPPRTAATSDNPESSSPDDSPGFLLWRTTLRWQRVMAAALKPLGLTHVQFVLLVSLWWLDAQGARPSQRELAEHAGTDVMMTSQVLRALEAKGLLVRDADAQDARRRRLAVTAQGAALARESVAVVEAADREFFEVADDLPGLLPVLRRLATWER